MYSCVYPIYRGAGGLEGWGETQTVTDVNCIVTYARRSSETFRTAVSPRPHVHTAVLRTTELQHATNKQFIAAGYHCCRAHLQYPLSSILHRTCASNTSQLSRLGWRGFIVVLVVTKSALRAHDTREDAGGIEGSAA